MLPKEHGAWNVLAISLTAGWLALGTYSTPALCASVFFLLGFILRGPFGVYRQSLNVDLPRAKKAMALFLVLLCVFMTVGLYYSAAAPPASRAWMLWGAVPIGVALAGLYLWKRTLRFLLAEALGFLGLNLAVPVIYFCGPEPDPSRAVWLYSLFAGQSFLALTYVKVRRDWFLGSKKGTKPDRWKDGALTVALHAAFVAGILGCPHGGGSLALGPAWMLLRALGGVSFGRADLPIMKLGLQEFTHSIVYLLLVSFAWKVV